MLNTNQTYSDLAILWLKPNNAFLLVELALINQPSESINPTRTLFWKGGNVIKSLICLAIRPKPTPDGSFDLKQLTR